MKIDKAAVHLRDSKQRDGAILTFTWDEWRAFVAGVRLGEFDVDSDRATSH